MALLSHKQFGNEHLEGKWECIGSGGFGNVYKTRGKNLGVDVAIKLGCRDAGSLSKEAFLMEQASFNFVLRVYGIYKGCPPVGQQTMQEGIVMEFMERGSIETLQTALSSPPPWPLAFRLAHQIALGMNFLHSKDLVHQDLKPSNVLLDSDLNAKLADFGLSRVSTSASRSNQETLDEIGGTVKYMPPEAFKADYEPVRAFDVYSYGILLWSIFSGKEPYPETNTNWRVRLRIPEGDRPLVEELEKKSVKGLDTLVKLMKECWDQEPNNRPSFSEIIKITEPVLKEYKNSVPNAVCEVLNMLDPQSSSQDCQPSGASGFPPVAPGDVVDHPKLATQASASVCTKVLTDKEKAKFVQEKRAAIVQGTKAVMAIADELKSKDMIHEETYSAILHEKTEQEKVRLIYNGPLHSKVDKITAAFYDALTKHEPWLMQKLGC